jgi:hypothetical protein
MGAGRVSSMPNAELRMPNEICNRSQFFRRCRILFIDKPLEDATFLRLTAVVDKKRRY